ncbi:MAG: WecB/TagA/CpsF family glycosyltransferase [Candidatus Berkelbacteria bacterium]|nr:WecB/TagA/CpsF family glycosyltransferase [Candidatus Berkelbacteria bacterium]
MKRNTFEILGVKLDSLDSNEALARIDYFLTKKTSSIVTTPNTEFIIKAQNDAVFRDIINKKSLMNLPDSYGTLWAARFLTLWSPKIPILREIYICLSWFFSLLLLPIIPRAYHFPIKEKISGSDFIWDLSRHAAEKNLRLFLFGGAPTIAEQTALRLQTDIYGLRVSGNFEGDISRSNEAIEAIKRSKADILLVCLGAPRQEKWLAENLSKTGCKVGIGLGGTFDFVAKIIPRAPFWMQKSGLEWLYRLIIEPKRLIRQMALPKMAVMILWTKLCAKNVFLKEEMQI